MTNKLILWGLLIWVNVVATWAQPSTSQAQAKALNNYVAFANESIHGMLIVHRMLENFNQEVNKYVDLQSNQLNFYGNKDLPSDIFADPEQWFYQIAPQAWYATATAESNALPKDIATQLNIAMTDLQNVTGSVNELRFEIDDFIAHNDLNKTENQVRIYALLEKGADLYDDFYTSKEILAEQLAQAHEQLVDIKETKFNTQIDSFKKIHHAVKEILDALHFQQTKNLPALGTNLKIQIDYLQQHPVKNRHYDGVLTAAREVLDHTQRYIEQNAFPEKYALYGKAYYYYNMELVSSFNRYGSGLVKNMNAFIALANPTHLPFIEEPHYYKVIYPQKEINVPEQQRIIEALPARLEEREVVVRQQKIVVDERKLLLEIYDHKQADGDIISLNFNGNWILKDKALQKRPIKLIVELNELGENYLILHAQNLGDIPPNTIAVRYHYQGIPQTVTLNSDLNESEMIRLEYER